MKDRTCDNGIPMYQMPYVGPMMPMGMSGIPTNQNYDLISQIKSLEKRVNNLESIINNGYSNSNYQMM